MNNDKRRHTKIVATLGPSSNTPENISALATAGANVFRINFSHGSHEDHSKVHAQIRAIEAAENRSIAILADLQGPKIRIGVVPGGERPLEIGDEVTFVSEEPLGSNDVPLPHPEIFETVEEGHLVLIDDGRIRLRVSKAEQGKFTAEVLNAAVLKDRKGVNFPDTTLKVDPITEKDREDLRFALELGVDWVAMSFVQRAEDIQELNALIGGKAKIVAKIEKPIAVTNIDEILLYTDAIMVARGDLGVECAWHELPAIQRSLVSKARKIGKPVIVATQMLESMIFAPLPTRAETSDVANAVMQRADAVMLSAESAAGQYPIEAVEAMASIALATEAAFKDKPRKIEAQIIDAPDDSSSIASAAGILAKLRNASCIVNYTETGATAVRVAKTRSDVPILAICPNENIARPLNLVWGVTPTVSNCENEFKSAREGRIPASLDHIDLIKPDQPVVVTSGSTMGQTGSTDSLKIAYLGR
ncbi:MAG: pyruvate kinase [Rhizobiaceae bacterium]|nr:pyruvate kinase [Rhizobiaceae bacterium]